MFYIMGKSVRCMLSVCLYRDNDYEKIDRAVTAMPFKAIPF